MSAKTKIVVLHLKELIYTGLFAVLGILFIILLIIMFLPNDKSSDKSSDKSPKDEPETASAPAESETYEPGTYSTSLSLKNSTVSVEVDVSATEITDLRLVNMDEAVATMYPLIEPSFEDLTDQILEVQNLEDVTYADENRYTYMMLLNAIDSALEEAKVDFPGRKGADSESKTEAESGTEGQGGNATESGTENGTTE